MNIFSYKLYKNLTLKHTEKHLTKYGSPKSTRGTATIGNNEVRKTSEKTNI